MDYIPIGGRFDGVPIYLVSETIYALSDQALVADARDKGIAFPTGTIVTKAGFSAMKQLGPGGTFADI